MLILYIFTTFNLENCFWLYDNSKENQEMHSDLHLIASFCYISNSNRHTTPIYVWQTVYDQ